MCRLFAIYGRKVARYPIPFIVVPVTIALAFSGGFAFLTRETDVEYLFTPEGSQAKKDQTRLKEDFKSINDFVADRRMEIAMVAQVIIVPKFGDNLWKQSVVENINDLGKDIKQISTNDDGKTVGYKDVCMEDSNGDCVESVIDLFKSIKQIKYPYHTISIPGLDSIRVFLGQILGGVKTDSNDVVIEVKAIKLNYVLKNNDEAKKWIDAFIETLQKAKYNDFDLKLWTWYSIDTELIENTNRMMPYGAIAFAIMITFSIVACTLLDPVRTKPWLGEKLCLFFQISY